MDSLMKYIARIFRCSILYYNDALAEAGLNGYQRTYIVKICDNPGVSQEQLARMILVNKSNVTRQLALLEQNGFITREPGSADKRKMLVYPTEKALAIYPKVKEITKAWNEHLTADLSGMEREALAKTLEALVKRAEIEVGKSQEGGQMG